MSLVLCTLCAKNCTGKKVIDGCPVCANCFKTVAPVAPVAPVEVAPVAPVEVAPVAPVAPVCFSCRMLGNRQLEIRGEIFCQVCFDMLKTGGIFVEYRGEIKRFAPVETGLPTLAPVAPVKTDLEKLIDRVAPVAPVKTVEVAVLRATAIENKLETGLTVAVISFTGVDGQLETIFRGFEFGYKAEKFENETATELFNRGVADIETAIYYPKTGKRVAPVAPYVPFTKPLDLTGTIPGCVKFAVAPVAPVAVEVAPVASKYGVAPVAEFKIIASTGTIKMYQCAKIDAINILRGLRKNSDNLTFRLFDGTGKEVIVRN